MAVYLALAAWATGRLSRHHAIPTFGQTRSRLHGWPGLAGGGSKTSEIPARHQLQGCRSPRSERVSAFSFRCKVISGRRRAYWRDTRSSDASPRRGAFPMASRQALASDGSARSLVHAGGPPFFTTAIVQMVRPQLNRAGVAEAGVGLRLRPSVSGDVDPLACAPTAAALGRFEAVGRSNKTSAGTSSSRRAWASCRGGSDDRGPPETSSRARGDARQSRTSRTLARKAFRRRVDKKAPRRWRRVVARNGVNVLEVIESVRASRS